MGKSYAELEPRLIEFLHAQRVFFVATAPSSSQGHLNLSPKGFDAFRVLGPRTVAYLDYNGSGVETIAHVRENARIVFMFCAFEGPPKIVRLHGKARVVSHQDADFASLVREFSPRLPVRAILHAEIFRIADSCGYGVPFYAYEGERDQAPLWAEKRGEVGIAAYQAQKNAVSIDGLPGLPHLANPDAKSVPPR